ncbi:hypothetical protein, partial [Nocardioides sp.]|uniref:hypothetical protein n=1 Tax=Nocardioides sp. TaxID=35761 RepID=UPI001A315901
APPAYPGAHAYPPGPRGPVRPAALVWACVLAWVGSALVAGIMLLSVAVVLAAPDTLLDEIYRQNPEMRSENLTVTTLRSSVIVVGTLLVAWAAAAATVAVFAWRGRSWAWTALLVSACAATVLCLAASLGSPVMLLALLLCAPAIPLLLRPEVRAFATGR